MIAACITFLWKETMILRAVFHFAKDLSIFDKMVDCCELFSVMCL